MSNDSIMSLLSRKLWVSFVKRRLSKEKNEDKIKNSERKGSQEMRNCQSIVKAVWALKENVDANKIIASS